MRIWRTSLGLPGLCAFLSSIAAAQQVGADEIGQYMLNIVERKLTDAGVLLSLEGRAYLDELVRKGAESIYEQDALNEVVSSSEALANRLVEQAKSGNRGFPTVLGAKADQEAICPLHHFC